MFYRVGRGGGSLFNNINTGASQVTTFLTPYIYWLIKSRGLNKIYPVLFLFGMFTDQMLYNWYFFYLILWMLYGLKKSEYKVAVFEVTLEELKLLAHKGLGWLKAIIQRTISKR